MISTAKSIVLEKYHRAVALRDEVGTTQHESWSVYVAPGLGQRKLASGRTEQEAWTNASTVVLGSLRQPESVEISREVLNYANTVGGGPDLSDAIRDLQEKGLKVKAGESDGP